MVASLIKFGYQRQHVVEPAVVKRIKNIFALPFGIYHTCTPQYGQVLRSHGLHQPEVNKNVGNGTGLFFVDKQNNVYAKLVVQRPQQVMCFAQLQFVAL